MAERIREVWANNLEEEMSYLRAAIEKYPFVAMVRPALSYPPCTPSRSYSVARGQLEAPPLFPSHPTPSISFLSSCILTFP